jgi:transposase
VLEGSFELVLANAQHVRNVPGRKSDVNDAMWLADLLARGLVQGSFVLLSDPVCTAHICHHWIGQT